MNRKIDAALLPLNLNLDALLTLTPNVRPMHPFTWTSIDTLNSDDGGSDLIRGNGGDDIILGGQGGDLITGGVGDDDIIGGHNGNLFAGDYGTNNNLGGHDGNDLIDAGTGNDTVAGDNADILRTGAPISVRMRVLSGETIFDSDGNALVTDDAQRNPTGAVERFIRLYDHNDAPIINTFGNDSIAGGADNDVIFGQLGNDDIQGDGSVIDDAGRITVNARVTHVSVEDWAGIGTDGDDYIEGNGGEDLIFGDLGQDDLIGDSSNQFSLVAPQMRPAGSDTLFGGAGTRIAMNILGAGADSTTGSYADHARDADTILGDNGNLFRLVVPSTSSAGTVFLTFVYDSTSDIGSDPASPFTTQARGPVRIIPHAYQLLDYTPGVQANTDRGAWDLIRGEDGDDFVHGEVGHDVMYGDGWDDRIIGGTGMDKIFGGTGEDSILGDDGLIKIARDGLDEPLYGLTATTQTAISLPGPWTGAVVDITGILKTTVDLTIGQNPDPLYTWMNGYADIVYGGLGDDWIHGGADDDAISGAEALPQFFNDSRPEDLVLAGSGSAVPFLYNRDLSINYFVDPFTKQQKLFYDADNPRTKIDGYILNFVSFDTTGQVIDDGKDWIYGDNGNDVLFGGTDHDRLFGGRDDDYLQLDDNLNTDGGLNNNTDDASIPQVTAGTGDFAYGGDGLDVLIANSGNDRMFDWGGEFNSFLVPFARFGNPTVVRSPSPHIQDFLIALSAAGGNDPDLTEPNGEMGFFVQSDPEWHTNHGGPRDPQAGNYPKGTYDNPGGPEDDTLVTPLQTAAGSTPVGGFRRHGFRYPGHFDQEGRQRFRSVPSDHGRGRGRSDLSGVAAGRHRCRLDLPGTRPEHDVVDDHVDHRRQWYALESCR